MHACTFVHSVPAGEQVAHLYTPPDSLNGTRGPNYILMASVLLLASSREQEQNEAFAVFCPCIILLTVAGWGFLETHLFMSWLCKLQQNYEEQQLKQCKGHNQGVMVAAVLPYSMKCMQATTFFFLYFPVFLKECTMLSHPTEVFFPERYRQQA